MKIVVIGNGKMAADCIKMMLNHPIHTVDHVFFEPDKNVHPTVLLDLINEHHLPSTPIVKIHDESHLNLLDAIQPEWIFNINCYQYLRPIVLTKAQYGIINFHNGPLPRYGGVNIPTWVILNGEQQHGVTWHMVNEEIDAGHVLSQNFFEVTPKMTAAQLMVKCIQEGILLFEQNWLGWVEHKIKPKAQEGERLYFGLKDKVPNNGLLKGSDSCLVWDRSIRALHLFPYPNAVAYAHVIILGKMYFIITGKQINDLQSFSVGTIFFNDSSGILIQLSDGQFSIGQMADEQWSIVKPAALRLVIGETCLLDA